MQTTTRRIRELPCTCGASRNTGSTRCGKCLARARWYRRKAWRSYPDPAIKRTGKK
jgi:hypothetical protein